MSDISELIDEIFIGLRVFIPLLILLKFSKILSNRIDIRILITATNWLLLVPASAYFILLASEIFAAYYSQSQYEQLALTNRIFGSYWFAFAFQAFIYLLLPQIMWLKKARESIIATITWSLFAYALAALVFYVEHSSFKGLPFGYSNILLSHLKSLIIFIPLLIIVYFLLLKRDRLLMSKQQA